MSLHVYFQIHIISVIQNVYPRKKTGLGESLAESHA